MGRGVTHLVRVRVRVRVRVWGYAPCARWRRRACPCASSYTCSGPPARLGRVRVGLGLGGEGLRHAWGHLVLELATHDLADGGELVRAVVGELNMVADARVEAGDIVVEGLHAVCVSGHDDDEVLLVVLHDVEKDLDTLLPVV